jgi:hypothetical protein
MQGRRNDVKARRADFRERALLNWYFLRDVCKTSGVELRLIMFSIYWMIGVWGGFPQGDCAILEARWLHFLRFLKQIRKRIALTIRYFPKAILWIERAPLPPLPLLVKGNGGGCPPPQFRRPWLNGYVTNPNPNSTLTLTLTLTELIKKSKNKRLYKIDRAVCWMEKSANLLFYRKTISIVLLSFIVYNQPTTSPG